MSNKPLITDAEFEVIEGPYRIGDEHRKRKRWFWTGTFDRKGVPLWYRPPRFNKWQFALVWIAGLTAAFVIVVALMVAWSYFGGRAPAVALAPPTPAEPRSVSASI